MTVPATIILSGTVENVSRPNKDDLCTLEIRPDFNGKPSKFTRKITSVPHEHVLAFQDGDRVTVNLKRGRQKDDGDPEEERGWWFDYQNVVAGAPPAPTPAASAPKPSSFVDGRDASIERQVALKAAVEVEIAVAKIAAQNGEPGPYHILELADLFDHWLKTGRVDVKALGQEAKPHAEAPEDEGPF